MKHHKYPKLTLGLRTERTQIFPKKGSSCRPSSEDSPQKTHLIINCEYLNVVLNKSSQELPFRKSFACFRGPIGVAFSKIENSYKDITSLL